jgi:hypothetical protein
LHYRELARLIKKRLADACAECDFSLASLQFQLRTDPRFVHSGRSGCWSLAEWPGVRSATVVELMKEFFHRQQRAATSRQVYDYVRQLRPDDVAPSSVTSYLHSPTDGFVRVSEKEYGLAEWGGRTIKPRQRPVISEQELYSAVKAAFSDGQVFDSLGKLVRAVQQRTGLSSSALYRKLRESPWLKRSREAKQRGYCLELSEFRLSQHAPRTSIRRTVQNCVREYLNEKDGGPVELSVLAAWAISQTRCKKYTFYRYLSGMPGLRKHTASGRVYCSLTQKDAAPESLARQVQEIPLASAREEAERGVRLLDSENVGLGLFQLGRLFEASLRSLLTKYAERGAADVSPDALARLGTMADCALQLGLGEKHTLDFLRQVRNEQAHQGRASAEQRQRLLTQAPYIAGLFLNYIALFTGKEEQIR